MRPDMRRAVADALWCAPGLLSLVGALVVFVAIGLAACERVGADTVVAPAAATPQGAHGAASAASAPAASIYSIVPAGARL